MTQSHESPNAKAWVLLILVSVIWGTSFILIKKGLTVFSAGEVGALRIFTACLALIPFSTVAIRKIKVVRFPQLFIAGLIGSFLPAMLFALAQTRLDSAIAGVGNAFVPIFVIIIGYFFFKAPIKLTSLMGVFCGFGGCVFISLGGANFELGAVNYYILFILLATVMYASNVNFIKHFLHDIKPLHLTSVSFLLICPFCAAYLFLGTDFLSTVSLDREVVLALTFVTILGVINTALAMYIFNNLIKIASPVFASSCTYIIPVVSIAWGLVDGEVLNAYQYLGIAIILVGVYLANRK